MVPAASSGFYAGDMLTAAPPRSLRWWPPFWRYALMILISIVSVGAVMESVAEYRDNVHGLAPVDALLGVWALVIVGFRRRWPFAVALLVTAASAVAVSVSGPWVLAVASLATHRRWWQIAAVAGLTLAAENVQSALHPDPSGPRWLTAFMAFLVTGMLVAVGAYTGTRRDLLMSLRERAETAEREETARVAQARTAERAAIAREMHDVLAHRISLVAMHAGALAYRDDLTAEQTKHAAETIQSTAHAALSDLRGVLGVLRSGAALDATGLPERPQPSLDDLPELIRELEAAGSEIVVHDVLPPGARPPQAVGRHAYRILQESCTNASKHAPGEPITIVLGGRAGDELLLEVSNPLPRHALPAAPGSRLGLIGLAERADLAGGRLDHEHTRDDQFRVRAALPWPREEKTP